jgi:hypothetical protein
MERLLTKREVRELGLTEAMIRDFLPLPILRYNFINPKTPVKLYNETDVLEILQNEFISAVIKLNNKHNVSEKIKRCRKDFQDKQKAILDKLISEINVIELPESILRTNALISLISTSYMDYTRYIISIKNRITENAWDRITAKYIVHNLIEFSPLYCRLRNGCIKRAIPLEISFRRAYVEAIVLKTIEIYPWCEPYILEYFNRLSGQFATVNFDRNKKNFKSYKNFLSKQSIRHLPKSIVDLPIESEEYDMIQDKIDFCKLMIKDTCLQ